MRESSNDEWQGPEEVLLKIFSYLDVNDLLSCKSVCVAWRSYLNEGFWRTMLRKMAKSKNGGWRTWGRLVARRKQNGASDQDCCEAIQQVRNNWQLGNYQMHTKHYIETGISILAMDYDHFFVRKWANNFYSERKSYRSLSQTDSFHTCEIDTSNCSNSHKMLQDLIYSVAIPMADIYASHKMFQNRIFNHRLDGNISVYDGNDGSEVCKLFLPNGGEVTRLFMDYRNRLVAFGYDFRKKPQLLVWQMNDQGQFTLIHQQSLERLRGEARYMYVEMDDQYVAIWVENDLKISISIYFFSLNTMKIEGTLNDIPLQDSYVYRSGLMFNLRSGYIRVLDVALKKQVARILTPNQSFTTYHPNIWTTSEYVIIHTQLANQRNKSVLQIYKLEEIRHSKIDIREPHTTIELPKAKFSQIFVDETKIVLVEGSHWITCRIIDFS